MQNKIRWGVLSPAKIGRENDSTGPWVFSRAVFFLGLFDFRLYCVIVSLEEREFTFIWRLICQFMSLLNESSK